MALAFGNEYPEPETVSDEEFEAEIKKRAEERKQKWQNVEG